MAYIFPAVAVSALVPAAREGLPLLVPGGHRFSCTVNGTFTGAALRLRRQMAIELPAGTINSQTHIGINGGDSLDLLIGATSLIIPYANTLSTGQVDIVLRVDNPGGDPMPFQPRNVLSGTLGQLNDVVGPVDVKGGGMFSSMHVGTFSGTVLIERSFDGTNWQTHDTLVNSEDYLVGASCKVRARCSAYTSGSLTVWLGVDQPGG